MNIKMGVFLLAGFTILVASHNAEASPKFVGICINDNQVKQLFRKYADVKQIGPWNTEEIQAGTKGSQITRVDGNGIHGKLPGELVGASRILHIKVPKGKSLVATICGSLGEKPEVNGTATTGEERLYPHGKPGHWCGYGQPGTCKNYGQEWFTEFNRAAATIVFVNKETAYQYGFVWAYVRPSDKSD